VGKMLCESREVGKSKKKKEGKEQGITIIRENMQRASDMYCVAMG